jgi:hypothetical protein
LKKRIIHQSNKETQKHPNGLEIGPAFSSIFMFMVMFVLVKTLVFATCLYHGDAFWHLISVGEIIVLLQWELKNAR